MATLATITKGLIDAADAAVATSSRSQSHCKLRALPNEDVFLFVKKIDNSRVLRETDPKSSSLCWQWIVGSGLSALLVIGLLIPNALSVMAGYQIESLKKDQKALLDEQAALDLQIASLTSPERLEALAPKRNLVRPALDKVVYLNPSAEGSVAMNTVAH